MSITEKWRIWIYYRLSRDEDSEMNSLKNQRNILMDYIEEHGHIYVGESFDDNVSGMTFDRDGIAEIYEAAAEHKMDAVLVKDLSRLGRHNTKTAVFIDYLTKQGIRVITATDNIDTFNDEDEIRIELNKFVNHLYARQGSGRVKKGYRQKQKDHGVCNMPPIGYYKDKNTNEIVIMEEPAEIVKEIYSLYLDGGYGFKAIAEKLNNEGKKSASYYQLLYNKKKQGCNKPAITQKHLWDSTAVKRVLINEFYTGTFYDHKEECDKARGIRRKVPKEQQFKHENFAPVIIPKDTWDKVQELIEAKKQNNVRASSGKPYHRYAGLLKCGDCGCTFVAKIRRWRDKPERVEYVCNGYHRYKGYCTSHRVQERDLDALIYKELLRIKSQAEENWKSIEKDVKAIMKNKANTEKKISDMKNKISALKEDIENILMERITDKENREAYDNMIAKRKNEIENLTKKIDSIKNLDETVKKRKAEIKNSIDILDGIIKDGAISNANLRLLISEIIILEQDNELSIVVAMKAPFGEYYGELFDEEGNIVLAHSGDYKSIA